MAKAQAPTLSANPAPEPVAEPVAQPLCEGCRNYDGGKCSLLAFLTDLHGPVPIVACGQYSPPAKSTDTQTDNAAGAATQE